MKINRPKLQREIPKNSKKVFSGITHDVYHWKQKMFDGSFSTFEMLRRSDTVDIIAVTEDKKIVLIEEEQPKRKRLNATPGGSVDVGETPIAAAKRELLEETGYKASSHKLMFTHQVTNKIDWLIYVFVALGCKKVLDADPGPGERIKVRLVDFDEFIEIVSDDNFRDAELSMEILRARLDPKRMRNLKNMLLA